MTDQTEHMTKKELLEQIRIERGQLEETLARLTHPQMLIPGVVGEWTVKDTLAHISTWERWMIQWISSLIRSEKPDTPEPWDIDRMNAGIFVRVKNFSLSDVLEEFRQSYWDSLALAEGLSEEQLQMVYNDTWPVGPLWLGVAANTNYHYRDHRMDIQRWLDSQKKGR